MSLNADQDQHRRNRLLAALRPRDYALLEPHLQIVPIGEGEFLHLPGDEIEQVYFLHKGIVSLATVPRRSQGGRRARRHGAERRPSPARPTPALSAEYGFLGVVVDTTTSKALTGPGRASRARRAPLQGGELRRAARRQAVQRQVHRDRSPLAHFWSAQS
jgi:hypothetical protein